MTYGRFLPLGISLNSITINLSHRLEEVDHLLNNLWFINSTTTINNSKKVSRSKSKPLFPPSRLCVHMFVCTYVLRHNFFFHLNRLGITP